MPKPAKWSVDRRTISATVDDSGTAHSVIPLMDDGKRIGSLILTMTPGRHLRVEWRAEGKTPELAGFEAWST